MCNETTGKVVCAHRRDFHSLMGRDAILAISNSSIIDQSLIICEICWLFFH